MLSKSRSLAAVGAIFALAVTFAVSVAAEANPGHGWSQGKGKRKRGHGYAMRCSKKLFKLPPVVLRKKLGLDDAQLKKVIDTRNNFLRKKIDLKRDIAHQKLKMRFLMETDLPDVNKCLTIMRAKRAIKAKLMEEKMKAKLWALGALTAEQRSKLRRMCRHRMGMKGMMRMMRRHHRGKGKPGMGRGPRADATTGGGGAGTPVGYDDSEN